MHSIHNHRHFEWYLLLECRQGILELLPVGRAFGVVFLNRWLVHSHRSQANDQASISPVATGKLKVKAIMSRPFVCNSSRILVWWSFVLRGVFGINQKHTFGSFETLGTLNAAIVAMARHDGVGKCEVRQIEKLVEASSDLVAACDDDRKRSNGVEQRIRIRNLIEEFRRDHKHLYSPRSPSSTTV